MDQLNPPHNYGPRRSPSPVPFAKKLPRRPMHLVIVSVFSAAVLLWLFSLLPLLSRSYFGNRPGKEQPNCFECLAKYQTDAEVAARLDEDGGRWTRNLTLFDRPMHTFRENLWPDKKYITSWGNAGFTNDFVSFMNLIYLGMLTERIPILPAVSKSHHVASREDFYLGDAFDIPALARSIHTPILEWASVKKQDSVEDELLGCWAPWWQTGPEDRARDCDAPGHLLLDLSYTKAPHWVAFSPGDWGVRLWALASLGFPHGRGEGIEEYQPAPSTITGQTTEPDDHLLCFDYLFYGGIIYGKDTFDSDHAPVWRFVAKHAKWLPKVKALGQWHLERVFGVKRGQPLPPFIALHVRTGDFETWCKEGITKEDCLPSLQAFATRVKEIQDELSARPLTPLDVREVLITTDEPRTDGSPFWEQVEQYGWKSVDHEKERTEEKYGGYFPVVIDQVMHSMAIGFVGTDQSTLSLVGGLRVKTWNGGVSRTVLWGHKNADSH